MTFFADLLGDTAANAATNAAAAQGVGADRAINVVSSTTDRARADLQPFSAAGQTALPPLTGLATSPQERANYVQDNPFYKVLADDAQQRLFGNAAARGKVGSGGTAKALQNSMMLLGQDLVNQDIGNLQNLANMGLNAASGQANTSAFSGRSLADLITGKANADASGIVGAANAQGQGASNLLGAGLAVGDLLTSPGSNGGTVGGNLLNTIGGAAGSVGDYLGIGGTGGAGGSVGAGTALAPGAAGPVATTTGLGASPAGAAIPSQPVSGGTSGSVLDSLASVPNPSTVANLLGGSGGFTGFAGPAGLGTTLGSAGAGLGTGISALGPALTAPGAVTGGFAGFAGPGTVLGSGIGTGATGGTVGAAAGGAPAAGLLAGPAGAVLGAAAPLALAAYGFLSMRASGDEQRAIMRSAVEDIASAEYTTVNGVGGYPFQHQGQSYLAAWNPNQPKEMGNRRGIANTYNIATGEMGFLGAAGFLSEAEAARMGTDADVYGVGDAGPDPTAIPGVSAVSDADFQPHWDPVAQQVVTPAPPVTIANPNPQPNDVVYVPPTPQNPFGLGVPISGYNPNPNIYSDGTDYGIGD